MSLVGTFTSFAPLRSDDIMLHGTSSLRYFIEILLVLFLSWLAGIAKVSYAYIYTSPILFNLFDFIVYGVVGLLIGLLCLWRVYILALIFIIPSFLVTSEALNRVYITRRQDYTDYGVYEWIASAIVIPAIAFLGVSVGKRFALKKQRHKEQMGSGL